MTCRQLTIWTARYMHLPLAVQDDACKLLGLAIVAQAMRDLRSARSVRKAAYLWLMEGDGRPDLLDTLELSAREIEQRVEAILQQKSPRG
jgi:hypothetical protein